MVAYTTTYNLKKPTVADDEDVWGGYLNDSMDLIDDVLDGTTPVTGIDINSGTLDNVTINSSAIGGTTAAAGTFTTLSATTSLGVTGNITVSGTVDGRDIATDGTKLDGIESGATADQTKADIDALGINAATLDSLDSTQFLRSDTADTINNVLTVSSSAYFKGNTTQGYRFNNAADSLNLLILADNGNATFHSSTITAGGNTVWHSGNDGSGSGLDADTLDGIDSGSFMRSDTADSFTAVPTFAIASGTVASRTGFSDFLGYNGTYGSYLGGGASNSTRYLYSGGYIHNGSGVYTLWHSGNDGSGSGLDADNLDGYTWDSSGKNLRGTEIYADNWFRNYNSGEGLYNEATGNHWVSNGSTNWTARTSQSYNQLELQTNGTSRRGSLYATSSNEIGILDSDNSWAYRHVRDSAHYWDINGTNYMILDGNGLHLVDGSLREDYDALSGTSVTCNANSGGAFSLSMSGNTTFTFSSVLSGYGIGFVLQLTGNGSTVTWPSSVDWAGGTAPDAPASGETDIYVFWTRDGGTTWYGVQSIDAAA